MITYKNKIEIFLPNGTICTFEEVRDVQRDGVVVSFWAADGNYHHTTLPHWYSEEKNAD